MAVNMAASFRENGASPIATVNEMMALVVVAQSCGDGCLMAQTAAPPRQSLPLSSEKKGTRVYARRRENVHLQHHAAPCSLPAAGTTRHRSTNIYTWSGCTRPLDYRFMSLTHRHTFPESDFYAEVMFCKTMAAVATPHALPPRCSSMYPSSPHAAPHLARSRVHSETNTPYELRRI